MDILQNSCRQIRNFHVFIHTFLWSLSVLAKTCVGITTSQPHTDQTRTELPKRRSSALLVQSGLSEKCWREAIECLCCLRNIEDKLEDRTFGTKLDGPVIPFEAFFFKKKTSLRKTNVVYISARKYRDTCRKRWTTNWEHKYNADVWKKAVQIPHTFNFMLADKIQKPGNYLFRFPSDAMLWIREMEMVDWVDELKYSRSIAGNKFPNFELLDARIASALNKIIQNSLFKKEGQSGGTENSERGLVSSRKTDRLVDLFSITQKHRS